MDLEECVLITDAALSYLAAGCPRLEKLVCTALRHIADLELWNDPVELMHRCYHLLLQSLSHCELITDDGIRSVGTSPCAAEHLAVLELDNCPLITDAALDNLISCHSLQRIELYDCQLITRAGIRRLRV
jgi:F-box/leucine-rich repeat protein 2/20